MVLVTCRRISRNVVPFLPTTDLSHLPRSVNTLRDRLKQMTMLTIFSFCFFVNGCDCHTHFAWGQYSTLNMIGSSLIPYGNYKAGNPSTAACNTCKFVWETRRWFTSLLDSAHSQYKCSFFLFCTLSCYCLITNVGILFRLLGDNYIRGLQMYYKFL